MLLLLHGVNKKLKHKQTQKANIKRLRELSLQELRLENADL